VLRCWHHADAFSLLLREACALQQMLLLLLLLKLPQKP
jgi:hypothetical protein